MFLLSTLVVHQLYCSDVEGGDATGRSSSARQMTITIHSHFNARLYARLSCLEASHNLSPQSFQKLLLEKFQLCLPQVTSPSLPLIIYPKYANMDTLPDAVGPSQPFAEAAHASVVSETGTPLSRPRAKAPVRVEGMFISWLSLDWSACM